jgi:ATP adenylyltransferase
MEKLWSPWRSQYIESFQKPKNSNNCIFCEALKNHVDDNSLVVDKGEYTFTVLNLYPYNNGHLMVVPNRHLSDFSSLNNDESIEIMLKLQLSQRALQLISHPDGFNIGANIGKVSGAGIADHIHFHIVPRWNGDTNFMPVLGEVKVLSQDLLSTKKKLIEAYQSLLLKY